MTENNVPAFARLTFDSLFRAIRRGWEMFLITRPLSVTYAMIFALIGILILFGIERASFAPMILPLTGGFTSVGLSRYLSKHYDNDLLWS